MNVMVGLLRGYEGGGRKREDVLLIVNKIKIHCVSA
jgi:hypothetical protein